VSLYRKRDVALLILRSIIQDCEDALTNWVESKAQVRPRLSQRGARPRRTGGRASRVRQPINLAGQDRPLHDDQSWVPADEHERTANNNVALNQEEDEYEDLTDDEAVVPPRHTGSRSSRRSAENYIERTGSLNNGVVTENGRARRGGGLIAED
jgi:hypothetical protein